jgi:hypothetical protein
MDEPIDLGKNPTNALHSYITNKIGQSYYRRLLMYDYDPYGPRTTIPPSGKDGSDQKSPADAYKDVWGEKGTDRTGLYAPEIPSYDQDESRRAPNFASELESSIMYPNIICWYNFKVFK